MKKKTFKKDIINAYKKQKAMYNTSIFAVSLIIALGVNFFILDGTSLGNTIKASILNIPLTNGDSSDIYLEKKGDKIILKSSKYMKSVKNIGFSLNYDPENVKVESINSSLTLAKIINLGNTPGISSIIVQFNGSKDLKPGDEIIWLNIKKKIEKKESINLVNGHFTDINGDDYKIETSGTGYLSTSGLDF